MASRRTRRTRNFQIGAHARIALRSSLPTTGPFPSPSGTICMRVCEHSFGEQAPTARAAVQPTLILPPAPPSCSSQSPRQLWHLLSTFTIIGYRHQHHHSTIPCYTQHVHSRATSSSPAISSPVHNSTVPPCDPPINATPPFATTLGTILLQHRRPAPTKPVQPPCHPSTPYTPPPGPPKQWA